MNYRIGVDIGGTSVKLAVVDENYKVFDKMRIPTGKNITADYLINEIIESCRVLMAKYNVVSVGIGSAGQIDPVNGVVIRAGNLPFRNEPVAVKISDSLGIPAFIDNDGTCALIGEKTAGACKGFDDAVIITIGTGIGGAIMMNDRMIRGHNFRAGELGHFVIDRNGEECDCGLHGCFEQYASASALIRQTRAAAEQNPESVLAKLCENGIDGKTAFDAKEQGCPVATAVLDEYGHIIADGINSLVYIFQPQMIVLSGGIANQGESLLNLFRHRLLTDIKVATTSLDGNGGIIGAALLGTDHAR